MDRSCFAANGAVHATSSQQPADWVELLTWGMLLHSTAGAAAIRWLEYHCPGRGKSQRSKTSKEVLVLLAVERAADAAYYFPPSATAEEKALGVVAFIAERLAQQG